MKRNLLPALAIAFSGLGYAASLAQLAAADSSKAFADANDRIMHAMMVEPTGDADRDFVAMMIPHHQGAVDMAKIELQYGNDPALKKMAEQIITSQESEIAFMKDWQKAHP